MGSENSVDLYRTEPGNLAGRYLRRFGNPFTGLKICRPGRLYPSGSWAKTSRFTGGKAAHRMLSGFAARTAALSFPPVGWKMIVSAVSITAGNMTHRGSALSSPARIRLSRRRSKFGAIQLKSISG